MYYNKKVMVGISGGVDSSVTAYLLKKKGYKVSCIFMKNWEEYYNIEYCSSKIDLYDAKKVCKNLKINFYTVNFSSEYLDKVFKPCMEEYTVGFTPNPDILCNKEIKFKYFFSFSLKYIGMDFIATGHYVRINKDFFCKNILLRGLDQNKDQSYFLYILSNTHFAKIIFPVGNIKKYDVRRIAVHLNLVTANKKESTGICFIGKRKCRDFFSNYLEKKKGIIFTINGDKIGKHKGLIYYTLGQRKGISIGGRKNKSKEPWFVVDKKVFNNILIIAQGKNNPSLMYIGILAKKIHWIERKNIINPIHCTIKIRSRQKDHASIIIPIDNECIQVIFNKPVKSITIGQSIVFYLGDICLGGGVIIEDMPLSYGKEFLS